MPYTGAITTDAIRIRFVIGIALLACKNCVSRKNPTIPAGFFGSPFLKGVPRIYEVGDLISPTFRIAQCPPNIH